MKKYDYLIVGAGLFGATFAWCARQAGKKCLIIERRNHVGGNVYCDKIEGINVPANEGLSDADLTGWKNTYNANGEVVAHGELSIMLDAILIVLKSESQKAPDLIRSTDDGMTLFVQPTISVLVFVSIIALQFSRLS